MKIKLLSLGILVVFSAFLSSCATSSNQFVDALNNAESQYKSGAISEAEYLQRRQEIISLAIASTQIQSVPRYSYQPVYVPRQKTVYYNTQIVGPTTTRCRSDGAGGVTCTTD